MQFLSVCFCKNESWPEQPIDLPCPESDVADWLTLDFRFSARTFGSLLAANPSILLWALSRFSNVYFRPPKSAFELVAYFKDALANDKGVRSFESLSIISVSQTSVESENQSEALLESLAVSTSKALARFLDARGNKETRKTLSAFLRSISKAEFAKESRPSKKTTRALVDRLVGKRFSVSDLKRARAVCWTRDATIERWESPVGFTEDQRLLISLLVERSETEADFQAKLQTAKLESMKQLAYGASHEINNPLANIASRAQALMMEEPHPDRRFRLAVIYEQSIRAHEMISDMMLFAHPPELNRESVNLRSLVTKIGKEARESLVEKEVEFVTRLGPNVECVTVDPTQLKVLLAALIRNSREAIHHNRGEIDLHLSVVDDMLRIVVTDNGEGVDDRVKPHLFDPFFSGREAGRGLGFGLSKVWRIAELHGGRAFLDASEPNVLTRFVVELAIK